MNQEIQQTTPPPNYLVWAILTTILCCLPFGIVSIIYSAQVNTKWMTGDHAGAYNSSKNARIWAWVSFAVGISVLIIYFILLAIGISAAFWADGFHF